MVVLFEGGKLLAWWYALSENLLVMEIWVCVILARKTLHSIRESPPPYILASIAGVFLYLI